MKYDLIVIGSGPGGYVAAIRASQLGMKVGVVERESLGGICLNWGCIPTKALLKSAQVYEYMQHADDYGLEISDSKPNINKVIGRSRDIAGSMSKGINFLFRKNKIDVIEGQARLISKGKIEVEKDGDKKEYEAPNILVATGGRSKELPNLQIDGKKIIGYREALVQKEIPKKMVIVGGGAIGVEFAYFYHTMGSEVTIVEYLDQGLLPREDADISKELGKVFKKAGINVLASTKVNEVKESGDSLKVEIENVKKGKKEEIDCSIVLSAVGITPNTENIGLEEVGVQVENGLVAVDEYYRTNVDGIYAIGDIVPGPALAHVASAEGIICVEKIAGEEPTPMNYNNLPSCTYCIPEVASVGYTEEQAKEKGFDIKVGKFPFTASGKAKAAGAPEGFVKVIFDAKYGEWLGCHMIGYNVTEIIAEAVVARKLETTGHEIISSVHPHPTISEAVMEATAAAYDEVIHL
ncbi:dihydrolipoyl dehydrogenase [Membranicola marinus]|uniref:Dihydrolipoyl dehydrogenase n=1 Tax=Membranihabitans marinus TaxID=1227546 RepID=A0A953HRS4_9BACT|nr:dihydrolipoyl dehydrogenase [Membranihabitans marinus]MBY5959738.1 dihydrolipoyl dehydrogenase [Membranihabitans marinus]